MKFEITYECKEIDWNKISDYEKQGFRKMKTGMARFINRDFMIRRGFTE